MVLEPKYIANNNNDEPSPSVGAGMDAMRKMLRSPLAQKKPIVGSSPCPGRIFGQPLEEIETERGIPTIVQTVCLFILNNGVHYEGIFRVNGNSRVVDRLRETFDKASSQVSLDPGDDIFAVASLLKMFLREIPDYLIPEKQTKQFVQVHEVHGRDPEVVLPKLRTMLHELPEENYSLLKYLSRFLVLVSMHEQHNKMSPTALGIVFAPNLFKCSQDLAGLREQGITNQICAKFITDYEYMFTCPPELSPATLRVLDVETMDTPSPRIIQVEESKKPRTPPPRPPPPKFNDGLPERSARCERRVPLRPPPPKQDDTVPTPSPRRNRPRLHMEQRHLSAPDGGEYSDDSLKENTTTRSRMRTSLDDELTNSSRASSPFLLADSDVESLGPSPRVSASTSDFVELTIQAAVREHMFGVDDVRSSDDSKSERDAAPSPRRKKDNVNRFNGSSLSVPDIYRRGGVKLNGRVYSAPAEAFSIQVPTANYHHGNNDSSPRETRETMENGRSVSPTPVPSPRRKLRRNSLGSVPKPEETTPEICDYDQEFEDSEKYNENQRDFVKRTHGPVGRPSPSRSNHGDQDENVVTTETPSVYVNNNRPWCLTDESTETRNHLYRNVDAVEQNHNSIRFLDKVDLETDLVVTSAGSSPGNSHRQPHIPRLDLTTLHQHGDGTDPISINAGVSLVVRRAVDDDSAQISPRPKINNYTGNDVTEVQSYTDSVWNADDDCMNMKSITKKIQGLKRRLKNFEETFEDENGYRPSASDKAAVPQIKQLVADLGRARKELKKLKDRTSSMGKEQSSGDKQSYERRFSDPGYVRSSSEDIETESPDIYRTFSVISRRLREKRYESGRAEDLALMSKTQVRDEKLAVQKGLLYFESLHGRPSSKEEKELMRPLYDRYRNVKRLLASSPRDRVGDPLLPIVLEDQQLEITPLTTAKSNKSRDPIRIPVASEEPDMDEFMVTRKPLSPDPASSPIAPPRHKPRLYKETNLHEMSLPDLLEEQGVVRVEKRRLRKILKDFEDQFYEETGQKVQKEDRTPMEAEYMAYKQTKAKLRLIDALINKNDPTVSL